MRAQTRSLSPANLAPKTLCKSAIPPTLNWSDGIGKPPFLFDLCEHITLLKSALKYFSPLVLSEQLSRWVGHKVIIYHMYQDSIRCGMLTADILISSWAF